MGIVGPSRNFTSIFGSSRATATSTRETALVVGLQMSPRAAEHSGHSGPTGLWFPVTRDQAIDAGLCVASSSSILLGLRTRTHRARARGTKAESSAG